MRPPDIAMKDELERDGFEPIGRGAYYVRVLNFDPEPEVLEMYIYTRDGMYRLDSIIEDPMSRVRIVSRKTYKEAGIID